jgi:hypothetical protein
VTTALKQRCKTIWRWSTVIGVLVFAALAPVMWWVGAELIPVFILSAVGGVVVYLALLFVLVPIRAPELNAYVEDAKVERVGDDVHVESQVTEPPDRELADYVRSYAFAKDHTIKTIVLLMAIGILIIAITIIHGPILFR